jgi:hypothetical protein
MTETTPDPTKPSAPFATKEEAGEAIAKLAQRLDEVLASEPRVNHYFMAFAADSADQCRTVASHGVGEVASTIFSAIYTAGQNDAAHAKRPEGA